MHPDKVEVELSTARLLVRKQFPGLADMPVDRFDSSGTVNAIFRVGDSWAARFPLRAADPVELAARLRAEGAAAARMSHHSPVPVPTLEGVGAPGHGYPLPWTLQTWLPGTVTTSTFLADSDRFAGDLASLVTALRKAPTDGETSTGRGRGGSLPDHDAWVEECLERSRGLLDTTLLRELWSRYRALPDLRADVLSHTDLIPANVLTDGHRLTGVLDADGFGAADPALDLVAGWHMLADGPRRLFRAQVGSDTAEWDRGKAWAFEQALGAVWYYLDSNRRMCEMGAWTLRRVVEDETGSAERLAPPDSRVWTVLGAEDSGVARTRR